MQEAKQRTIKGRTLDGEARVYTFNLMDAENGTMLFHEYVGLALANMDVIRAFAAKAFGDEDDESDEAAEALTLEALQVLPRIFDWDSIKRLAGLLLSGMSITKGEGQPEKASENGFGDYCDQQPMEVYTALFWAAAANYPKYFSPLLNAPQE
jgi:hypothetical protein